MKTLVDFIITVYPLLITHTVERMDAECVEGKVTTYWAGSIIRIDIKPRESK